MKPVVQLSMLFLISLVLTSCDKSGGKNSATSKVTRSPLYDKVIGYWELQNWSNGNWVPQGAVVEIIEKGDTCAALLRYVRTYGSFKKAIGDTLWVFSVEGEKLHLLNSKNHRLHFKEKGVDSEIVRAYKDGSDATRWKKTVKPKLELYLGTAVSPKGQTLQCAMLRRIGTNKALFGHTRRLITGDKIVSSLNLQDEYLETQRGDTLTLKHEESSYAFMDFHCAGDTLRGYNEYNEGTYSLVRVGK